MHQVLSLGKNHHALTTPTKKYHLKSFLLFVYLALSKSQVKKVHL
jgi:hypothetical protein